MYLKPRYVVVVSPDAMSALGVLLGRSVTVEVDRPQGSTHPRHPDIVYPIPYGFVPGTLAEDGEPVDAYVLGTAEPGITNRDANAPVVGSRVTGTVIAVLQRADDAEDKLVVAVDATPYTAAQIASLVYFQERFFRTTVITLKEELTMSTPTNPVRLPYRLAAIDLDDTLLGPDKLISRENAEAVRLLQNAGIHCLLASGRHHANMLRFHRQLDLRGAVVSCNGALVKEAESDTVYREVLLPPELAEEVVEEGDRRGLTQNYYHTDGRQYVRERTRWTGVYEERTENYVTVHGPLEDLSGHAALKILWIDAGEVIAPLLPEMRAHFGDRLHITITDPEYLEFMAPGVSKAAGINTVAERMGLTASEVVVFGDGNNDVEMLAWAGLGIAMPHGRPAAHAAADRIGPPGNPETAFARAAREVLAGW